MHKIRQDFRNDGNRILQARPEGMWEEIGETIKDRKGEGRRKIYVDGLEILVQELTENVKMNKKGRSSNKEEEEEEEKNQKKPEGMKMKSSK